MTLGTETEIKITISNKKHNIFLNLGVPEEFCTGVFTVSTEVSIVSSQRA